MLVPELKWPMIPRTLSSISRCATVVPVRGSAWSSCESSWNVTGLPPIVGCVALKSAIASCTPFCMSVPQFDCGPVSGAAKPILTTSAAMACAPDSAQAAASATCDTFSFTFTSP